MRPETIHRAPLDRLGHDCESPDAGRTPASPSPRPPSARSTPSSAAHCLPPNAGLDRSQPSPSHPAPAPEASRAGPANPGRSRAPRRRGIQYGRRLGHPRLAHHDHRNAPRRTLQSPFLPHRLRHRDHRRPPQLGQRSREGHQDPSEPPHRPRLRNRRPTPRSPPTGPAARRNVRCTVLR